MTHRLSRRRFLRASLLSAAVKVGAGLSGFEAARKGLDLFELHETWAAADVSNATFLGQHGHLLEGLEVGASFAPEQWPPAERQEALPALDVVRRELGIRRLRLGIRWSSSVDPAGRIGLDHYRPYIDYCLRNEVELCLNIGPIRTFRWPEEHVPDRVSARLDRLPAVGATIRPGEPLAQAALAYAGDLLEVLRRDYGGSIGMVQVENEPFYPLGSHRWLMAPSHLLDLVELVDAALPNALILVTSAGRLNLDSVRDLFVALLGRDDRFQGRLVSGFDYHYKTPLRDSVPVVRYFDQIAYARPLAPNCDDHIRDSRDIGFRIEVTEGQAEPYLQFTSPGNSAKDFRFLLLRCLDKVLDPRAAKLIRIWGVEELAKKMLHGSLGDEHPQIIQLIQTINAAAKDDPPQVRS